jgi:FtsH-binding integral membrane protein
MDEIGMVAVWLIIIMVAAIAGIGTDSPMIGAIVGVLATAFCSLLIIRRQPR